MKIAAALGVWPFWGWKIINHGGWFTQVKGRSWQKKRSSLYRSCLHERVILPDYRITLLLQFIHHFYNTFTSLLHHSFSLYITFTTLLHHFYIIPSAHTSLLRQFHPLCHLYIRPPSWTCWKRFFRLCRQRLTATQFIAWPWGVFGWEECRKQDLPRLSCVNFRAMHLRAYSCMP